MEPSKLPSAKSRICSGEVGDGALEKLAPGIAMRCLNSAADFSVDFLVVEPGSVEPVIVHKVTDEFLFLIEGELAGRVGGEPVELRAGGYVQIPRGTPHSFTNVGEENCRLLAVCAPRYDPADVYKLPNEMEK